MAVQPETGFKLQMLGIAGTGAKTTAPQDLELAGTVPGDVLKSMFLQRLNQLVTLGVMTPQQVAAFKQLLTDVEQGKTPPPDRKKEPQEPTPESILRTSIVNSAQRSGQNGDDTEGGGIFGFLADAFVTLGGGIYGAITEGSIDGFLQGAASAHQWAEENIPAIIA